MRKLKRRKAKWLMKVQGLTKVCKGRPSFFSLHWKEFV